ncbi:hypothetical protein [Maribacter sp. Asnod1-A12]|uniref:hypothetical protein n=1 Tax=Maribacter sp. Asnod1-A12 TaxID=3160576 RepID=UPI00386781CB
MRYKNTYITLEASLFKHLENNINRFNCHFSENDNNKVMIDKAVFMIDYIRHQKSIRKDDITPGGYIRVPSKFLNIYLQKDLRKYKDFLVRYGYIKTIPYCKEDSKSYGYKVCFFENKRDQKHEIEEYSAYEFLSFTYEKFLSKSLKQYAKIEQKKTAAERTTKHLTKWLNGENIQADWQAAFKFLEKDQSLSLDQKKQYSYSINRIRLDQWYFLRSTNDNRLHSNLTNLPSTLRKYLSHNGQKLVSLDIKTSQPYLLAGVFYLIIEKNTDSLEFLKQGLRCKQVRDKFDTVMNSITLSDATIADFRAYKSLVCDNDIYNYIGSKLSSKFISTVKSANTKGGYFDSVYNTELGRKEKTHFKDLRGFCKVLVLEYMYCSVENNSLRLKELRRVYPDAVNEFIDDFKYCKELEIPKRLGRRRRTKRQKEIISRSKKLFSKFLQQLEAFIVLDIVTKELSKVYPKMFMTTIHDSIIVPKNYKNEVKTFLQKKLFEMLGVRSEIKSELWEA